jgi:hypothetical protein
MRLYTAHGRNYSSPAFYSGYNELVYHSKPYNALLPNSVEAFFVTKDHWPENTQAFWHETGKMLLPRNGYWEVDKNGTRRIKRFRHTRKDFDIDNAMDAHCNFLREYGLSQSVAFPRPVELGRTLLSHQSYLLNRFSHTSRHIYPSTRRASYCAT